MDDSFDNAQISINAVFIGITETRKMLRSTDEINNVRFEWIRALIDKLEKEMNVGSKLYSEFDFDE